MKGQTVAHYRIVEKLGEGGMGEVYKAVDQRLDRIVAIKFGKEGFGARFAREAKTIASLNHPHICSLYDIGEFQGTNYLVMEFVEGRNLPRPAPVETALEYGIQIAEALQAAHQHGIIHRDLKPANILVTRDDRIKVLDFGIAKHARAQAETGESAITVTERTDPTLTADGAVVGTAAYMSPEQVEGKPLDARSDLFSFGAVFYELLTGTRAFRGNSMISTLSAILRDRPARASLHHKEIPQELDSIVSKCLEKDRESRYSSAAELCHALTECRARILRSHSGLRGLLRKPAIAVPAVLVLAGIILSLIWLASHMRGVAWAEREALPEITRLAEQRNFFAAFELAERAEKWIPQNPKLAQLWPEISARISVEVDPPGALVAMKPYREVDGPWREVGKAPISGLRIPLEYFRWRITAPKFETLEVPGPVRNAFHLQFRLVREGAAESGMAYVPKGTFENNLAGFGRLGPLPMEEYWIDKFEVTNRQFRKFVEAGGYGKQEYWEHPFFRGQRELTFQQAMQIFVDSSGRPGPATWEAGTYPTGRDDHPVGGVSWYEAAAFARFAGKSLPTLYHWYQAASVSYSTYSVAFSNFTGSGAVPAGKNQGVAGPGVFDTGGNVREWCWTAARSGRYILGGAWDTPTYLREWSEVRDPFDRSEGNGFRCVKYAGGLHPPATFAKAIDRPFRDYSKERPVSDETFRVFRSLYARESRPLKPLTVAEDAIEEHWTKIKVSYDAGYDAERLPAYLFLPKGVAPPYQAVVFFPGAGTTLLRDSRKLGATSPTGLPREFDFVLKSGRAVLHPIYVGTFERQAGVVIAEHNREQVTKWVKEVSRSVDYLQSRPDIQASAIAYYGWSWGSHMAPIYLSQEERFKAAVLGIGGLLFRPRTPETDEFNFVPRVKMPVLMVNANFDFIFPLETSARPMFRLLGTPTQDKRLAVLEGGHGTFAKWSDYVREVLNWLDRYLGPVSR